MLAKLCSTFAGRKHGAMPGSRDQMPDLTADMGIHLRGQILTRPPAAPALPAPVAGAAGAAAAGFADDLGAAPVEVPEPAPALGAAVEVPLPAFAAPPAAPVALPAPEVAPPVAPPYLEVSLGMKGDFEINGDLPVAPPAE